MEPPPRSVNALSQDLRHLDALLGIEPGGRSDWVWAVPAAVLVGTLESSDAGEPGVLSAS